jgi:hypothetical protein
MYVHINTHMFIPSSLVHIIQLYFTYMWSITYMWYTFLVCTHTYLFVYCSFYTFGWMDGWIYIFGTFHVTGTT